MPKKHKKNSIPVQAEPTDPRERALYDEAVFTWMAPQYVQHPKGKGWYIAAAIAVGFIILMDLFMADYTMALAVIVLAGVYLYVHRHHPPKHIKITISRMGIKVGDTIFPYGNIQTFWLFYNPPHITTLNLRVKGHFFQEITLQLDHEDPVPIREYLCKQIPEWEGKSEKFSDVILRILKL